MQGNCIHTTVRLICEHAFAITATTPEISVSTQGGEAPHKKARRKRTRAGKIERQFDAIRRKLDADIPVFVTEDDMPELLALLKTAGIAVTVKRDVRAAVEGGWFFRSNPKNHVTDHGPFFKARRSAGEVGGVALNAAPNSGARGGSAFAGVPGLRAPINDPGHERID